MSSSRGNNLSNLFIVYFIYLRRLPSSSWSQNQCQIPKRATDRKGPKLRLFYKNNDGAHSTTGYLSRHFVHRGKFIRTL